MTDKPRRIPDSDMLDGHRAERIDSRVRDGLARWRQMIDSSVRLWALDYSELKQLMKVVAYMARNPQPSELPLLSDDDLQKVLGMALCTMLRIDLAMQQEALRLGEAGEFRPKGETVKAIVDSICGKE